MNEIEVGEYIRTEKGLFGKCTEIYYGKYTKKYFGSATLELQNGEVIGTQRHNEYKHSKNIIDLIEDGDIVCIKDIMYDSEYKSEVFENFDNILCINNSEGDKIIELNENIENKQIELLSILTHEIYEREAYKIE